MERDRKGTEQDLEILEQSSTDRFTAQLASETGKVHDRFEGIHKAIDDLRSEMRLRTITLIVTIIVAFLGQAAMARYMPLPQPPAPQVIIRWSGE